MVKLAFEAPVGNTEFALEQSDYIFAIAPMLKIPEYASAVRRARVVVGKEFYLGNGAYEGKLIDLDEYFELCDEWKPDVVVAPDVIGDVGETLKMTLAFIEKIPPLGERSFKVMYVIQGSNDERKLKGFRYLESYDYDIIGLGLGAFWKDWRGRILFLDKLGVVKVPIHILGISNLADLVFWSGIATSIDTSLPFHLAQEGKGVWSLTQKGTKSLNWSDALIGERLDLAKANLELINEALSND